MKDLQKDFIPYDLALRMKQLGFDEPCIYYVDKQNNSFIYNFQRHPDEFIEWCGVKVISTPTFSQAFRWFREKYDLHHVIHHFTHKKGTDEAYLAEVGKADDTFSSCKTYKEAELACLKKLIEIVEEI